MVLNLFRNSQKIFEKQHNSILSAASIIQLAILFSSLLGFLRSRLLLSYFYDYNSGFEPGAALDAYMVAFRIPDFVFQLLVIGALSAAFIPVYSKYQNHSEKEAQDLANSMINLILTLFFIIAAAIFIFAYPLTQLLTGDNFTPEQLELATTFTRLMLFSQFFFAISSFTTGIIQANQRFLIPALAPLVYNLGIIIGIVGLSRIFGLYGAALGVVLGAFLHLLLQLPLAHKLGFRYRPVFKLSHPGVGEMSRLMGPRTVALSVDQIELLVFTNLATALPAGSYLIFTLAQQLMKAPVRIFGVPIGQASLPFLAKESAANQLESFKKTFLNSFHQILYLTLPATALLIVLRIPLVRILFGVKDFPWAATLLTGKLVAVMGLAIVAYATTQLSTRAFYALHDTKIPLISAIVSIFVSISSAVFFVSQVGLGVLGIAIGSVIGAFTQSLFLFVILSARLDHFSFADLLRPMVKMLISAALTGVFLWIPMRFFDQILDTTRTANLVFLTIAATATGGLVYLWLSRVFQIKELEAYLRLLDKLGNWKKVLSQTDETIDQVTPTI